MAFLGFSRLATRIRQIETYLDYPIHRGVILFVCGAGASTYFLSRVLGPGLDRVRESAASLNRQELEMKRKRRTPSD